MHARWIKSTGGIYRQPESAGRRLRDCQCPALLNIKYQACIICGKYLCILVHTRVVFEIVCCTLRLVACSTCWSDSYNQTSTGSIIPGHLPGMYITLPAGCVGYPIIYLVPGNRSVLVIRCIHQRCQVYTHRRQCQVYARSGGVRYIPTSGVNMGCGVLRKASTKTTLPNTAVCYVSRKCQPVYSKP